jgi:hypothetical protein
VDIVVGAVGVILRGQAMGEKAQGHEREPARGITMMVGEHFRSMSTSNLIPQPVHFGSV